MDNRNKTNGTWTALNQYLEINTASGECRLKDTKDIVPNLRYTIDGVRNYAVKSFKEKRSTDITNDTLQDNLPILPDEEWRWVIGVKGVNDGEYKFKVSNLGRYANVKTGEILRQPKTGRVNKEGEYYRSVSMDGVTIYSHKGVALAFCYNDDPEHKTVAHHKDFHKLNNRADNLEWMTPAEHNSLHGKINGKHYNRTKQREAIIRPIAITDEVTGTTVKYESITDAAKDIKAKRADIRGKVETVTAKLAWVARGKAKSAYGYTVKYVD